VNQLFNRMEGEAAMAVLRPQRPEGDRIVARVRVAGVVGDLEAAVRGELGTDKIMLEPRTPPGADTPGAHPR
jgi:hypothetical protein